MKQTAPSAAAQSRSAGISGAFRGVAVVWTDEVEPVLAQPRERLLGALERVRAAAEVVVRLLVERVDAHRDARDAGLPQHRDARLGERRAVRAHDHGRAAARGVGRDLAEVVAHERLAAAQDQHRGRVDGHELVDHATALGRGELPTRRSRTVPAEM